MLEALEQGVKGGRWYSLMDKVVREANLRAGFREVKARKGAPGVDHVTVEQFEKHLDENVEKIGRQLKDGTYRPQANRRKWIDKPGSPEKRPLGIPTVRDRVTQTALKQVTEPIFEREFAEPSRRL
jgi:RNA-directed DNA polymerase